MPVELKVPSGRRIDHRSPDRPVAQARRRSRRARRKRRRDRNRQGHGRCARSRRRAPSRKMLKQARRNGGGRRGRSAIVNAADEASATGDGSRQCRRHDSLRRKTRRPDDRRLRASHATSHAAAPAPQAQPPHSQLPPSKTNVATRVMPAAARLLAEHGLSPRQRSRHRPRRPRAQGRRAAPRSASATPNAPAPKPAAEAATPPRPIAASRRHVQAPSAQPLRHAAPRKSTARSLRSPPPRRTAKKSSCR